MYYQTTEQLFSSGCETPQLILKPLHLLWAHPVAGIKNIHNYTEKANLPTDAVSFAYVGNIEMSVLVIIS